jgi:hypothetical protein
MDRSFTVIGYRMPMAVGLLAGLMVAATIVTALARQAGSGLAVSLLLVPAAVFQGQVWRLATWSLVQTDLLGFVFALVALALWLGPDLCVRWGSRRFLAIYFGFTIAVGAAVCALALYFQGLRLQWWASSWAILSALIVGWALQNQHAQIRFMLFIPANGRQIVWLTLGLIVLAGLFSSPILVIPDLIAFALALLYFRDPALRMLWYRLRLKAGGSGGSRRPTHLRPVETKERPTWYH